MVLYRGIVSVLYRKLLLGEVGADFFPFIAISFMQFDKSVVINAGELFLVEFSLFETERVFALAGKVVMEFFSVDEIGLHC